MNSAVFVRKCQRKIVCIKEESAMDQKEFLSQYGIIAGRIKLNKIKISDTENQLKEHFFRGAENCLSDYQDKLYLENEELYKLRYAIEKAVDNCWGSETEHEILTRRYIFCEKWYDIADEMNYSLQHIHRLHNSALKKINVPLEYKDMK